MPSLHVRPVRVDAVRLPVAVPLADTKSQAHRRAVYSGGVLTITTGHNTRDIASYAVRELTHVPFPQRAFVLTKLTPGSDPEAADYAVLIDPAGYPSCECKGFLRHDHCRHVDALTALLAEGAFDPDDDADLPDVDEPTPLADPFPSPEQLAADAPYDVPPYAPEALKAAASAICRTCQGTRYVPTLDPDGDPEPCLDCGYADADPDELPACFRGLPASTADVPF